MASGPDGAGLTDGAIADLTDSELAGLRLAMLAESERLRRALSSSPEWAHSYQNMQLLGLMQASPDFWLDFVSTLAGSQSRPPTDQEARFSECWALQRRIDRERHGRLAEMLRGARRALGLSLRDVARVAGIHSKFVDEIERGLRPWTASPDLFERACTEGRFGRGDCTPSLSLWLPLADPRLCRTIRGVEVDPAWLSGGDDAVSTLARSIREDRSFDLLPILGDALEEAGCADPDILAHCRGPGEHARGCWVVEALVRAGRPGWLPPRP